MALGLGLDAQANMDSHQVRLYPARRNTNSDTHLEMPSLATGADFLTQSMSLFYSLNLNLWNTRSLFSIRVQTQQCLTSV
jgi:hypothetical protein